LLVRRSCPKRLESGVVPELGDPDVREIPVYSWRLIYQVRGGQVFVLALIHKRRMTPGDPSRAE
jgi:hypothetical protein